MEIRKFKHIKNNKTVYAVIGAKSSDDAREFVRKYKKINHKLFQNEYACYCDCCINTINNKLYVSKATAKHEKPCYIIAKSTIDILGYAC